MKLIKAVEIAYFRSFYKERVADIEDLTIFFGRNDSGKSNVLRALNLFFNQQTNPGFGFDFGLDFNHDRLAEATDGDNIRKFIYIKLTFNTPQNYRASLGDEFSVKRQWSISSGQTFHQEISRSVPQARHQYVTRLLNQIQFHYIPAVKDRRIFSWLFQKIYSIIVSNADFSSALGRFSAEIQTNTDLLFKDLEPILGFKSALAPPNNLTELFGALDVDTISQANAQSLSLILQRGDGLQVRHIPEILKFLSDHGDGQFHVWGFEEPENSLELAFAFDEAKRFLEIAQDENKQLFVTSHSPAFFTIENPAATKLFVARAEGLSTLKKISGNDEKESLELMGDSFYLPLISSSVKAAFDEVEKLNTSIESLNAVVASNAGPLLFVEGATDKAILELAHRKLFGDAPAGYSIRAAGGTLKMKALCADGPALSVATNERKIFVLTDNDFEGRELVKNSSVGKWKKERNQTQWWMLRPTEIYLEKMSEIGFGANMYFFCIEDCFPIATRQEAEAEIVGIAAEYKFNAPRTYPIKVDHPKLTLKSQADSDFKFCICGPNPEAKDQFVEWLRGRPAADFEYFREFFAAIEEDINS